MKSIGQRTSDGFVNCWAIDRCRFYREEGEAACRREACTAAYLLLKFLYDESGMPAAYQRARITDLKPDPADGPDYEYYLDGLADYVSKVRRLIPEGKGLYIYARGTKHNPRGTGTGKTTAAAAIMNEWFLATAYTANLRPMGSWVAVPDWLEYLRPSSEEELPSYLSKERLQTVPLVVLDDLGAEKASEWVQERIYNILNHRVANGLATIVTSNFTVDEIAERLGYRVASRLESLTGIDLTGIDRRRKGARW